MTAGVKPQQRGQRKLRDVDNLYDVLGQPVDKGIRETVAIFQRIGLHTRQSCEGHIEHGLYPVPKQRDLELLERMRAAVPGYLSLRGGSGTRDAQFRGAVERGISKININSEMRKAYRTTLEEQLQANPDQFAGVKLMGPVLDVVQVVVEHKLDVFGAAGKSIL